MGYPAFNAEAAEGAEVKSPKGTAESSPGREPGVGNGQGLSRSAEGPRAAEGSAKKIPTQAKVGHPAVASSVSIHKPQAFSTDSP